MILSHLHVVHSFNYGFHERARKGRINFFKKMTFSIAVWHECFDTVVLRMKKKLCMEIYY